MNDTTNRATIQYFALAFGISWILGVVVAAVLQAILPESMDRLSLLVAKFGPSIAGVVMASVVAGREGLSFLIRSATRLRGNPMWFAVAIFTPPLSWALVLVVFRASGGDVDWSSLRAATPVTVLLTFATFIFLGGGLGEELGWRGFALPMLQRRYSALLSSLVLGIVWAAWHYPAILLDAEGDTSIVRFTLFVLAATVFLTWLFNSTRGNVLLAVLFHASFNASETLVDGAVPKAAEAQLEWWLVSWYLILAGALTVRFGATHLGPRERTTWPESIAPRDRGLDREELVS